MAAAGQWCILRTSGRLTLPLAESLTGDGYEVWTPVDTRRVRVPRMNARRVVKLPLIAGFVFAKDQHLADLLELERIRPGFRVMFYNGEPAKAPDHELEPLRQAEHMVEPKRWTSAFAPGSEVRITKGSFSGATGIVKSCNGKEAELWVSIFGRHHRVKINTFNLKLNRAYPVQAALAA
jgi:transcription antitermination factor NusG